MFTITNVTIYPANLGKLKAFASIEIDSAFVVKGIRIIDGANGLFIAMPASKGSDGNYYDDCFPITQKAREDITEAVLSVYESEEQEPEPKKTTAKKSYKKK